MGSTSALPVLGASWPRANGEVAATAARPQELSLAWLRRNEPEVYAYTRFLCMASSFIAYRLTGEYGLDHHSASQCDPHCDLHEHRWIDEWAGGVVDQSIVIHLLQVVLNGRRR